MKSVYILLLITFPFLSQDIVLELDTNLLRIGERFTVTTEFHNVDSNDILNKNIEDVFDDFEILNTSFLRKKNQNGETFFSKEFILTSFDTGTFVLPSVPMISQENDTIFNSRKTIYFFSMEMDSLNQFFDIKPTKNIPFEFSELFDYIHYFVLLLLLIFIIYFLVKFFKKEKLELEVPSKIKIPIDIYFLQRIELLESKDYLSKQDYHKFYIELSEILRGYIECRFNIPALESSSSDLRFLLEKTSLKEMWLNDFLRISDLVKFAKGLPKIDQSRGFLDFIKVFIKKHGVKESNSSINNDIKEKIL